MTDKYAILSGIINTSGRINTPSKATHDNMSVCHDNMSVETY